MQLIFLVLVSLLPLLPLLNPGIPSTHDGPDHVARIANFYQSLSEWNLVPRWAANLNRGYGHPILMFLYPLPSYIASFFHFIGFSLVDSTKLVFALGFIGSILAFYLWASKQWNKSAGLVGALLYGFAPYRFVDLYVRGAIGEYVAFIFPPLIFLGLLNLARKPSYWWGFLIAVSTAALILSHNAISIMFLPIIVIYAVYLFIFETKNKKEFIVLGSWFLVLGFLISSFFVLPAFFEGKYTLRDIVTKGEFAERFVNPISFFRSEWSYGGSDVLSKEIGIIQWLAVIASILLFQKIKERKNKILLIAVLTALALSLFLMTQWAEVLWKNISLLQKFQFPWRFLSISVFVSAIVGSIVSYQINKRIVIFVVLAGILLGTQSMWKPIGFIDKPEIYYSGIYPSTTDTGESSPIWSVRFMEQAPSAPMEAIEGKAVINQKIRKSTYHSYEVIAASKSRLVENTLYFPGWQVLVDGTRVELQFQDPQYRGLMTFWVEKGTHSIEVVFEETKLRKIAGIISIIGLVLLLWRIKK